MLSSSAERVWVHYSNRTQIEVHFTRFTQIQHGFLDFRKAFRLSRTLPLKTPTIFNSLEEIDKMARHRNYRNYAYEDGTVNVPLIYYSTKYLDCYKKINIYEYELFKISTKALTYVFQKFLFLRYLKQLVHV